MKSSYKYYQNPLSAIYGKSLQSHSISAFWSWNQSKILYTTLLCISERVSPLYRRRNVSQVYEGTDTDKNPWDYQIFKALKFNGVEVFSIGTRKSDRRNTIMNLDGKHRHKCFKSLLQYVVGSPLSRSGKQQAR